MVEIYLIAGRVDAEDVPLPETCNGFLPYIDQPALDKTFRDEGGRRKYRDKTFALVGPMGKGNPAEVVDEYLDDHGHSDFIYYPTPKKALEDFETSRPDVILCDVMCFQDNGSDFIEKLRRLERSLGGQSEEL